MTPPSRRSSRRGWRGPARHDRHCVPRPRRPLLAAPRLAPRRSHAADGPPMTAGPMDPPIGDGATGVSASSVPPTVRRTPGRRRPTGAPPPLPRNIGRTGRAWIVGLVVLVAWMVVGPLLGPAAPAHRSHRRRDPARRGRGCGPSGSCKPARGDRPGRHGLDDVLRRHRPDPRRRWGSGGGATCSRSSAASLVLEVLGMLLDRRVQAGRGPTTSPSSVAGAGYSLPSAPAAVLSFTVVGIIYMLVVPGRPRVDRQDRRHHRGRGLVVASRLYLGVDHPFDVAGRRRLRRGHPAQRVPLLHAERGRSR